MPNRGAASRAATMNAAASAFSQGWANGARRREAKADNERQDRRLQMDEESHDAAMQDRELDAAVNQKRRENTESELNLQAEILRGSMERFSKADTAFSNFDVGVKQIDWGAPDAATKYEMLTRQYLPDIVQDQNILKKWETLNRVNSQSRAFVTQKTLEQMTQAAMEEAANIAPELALDPPKKEDGSLDLEAFSEALKAARKQRFEDSVTLREVSGRRAPAKPTLGPGAKAELGAVEDELRDVNKRLNEPKIDPDSKLRLVNRKSSLLKQLRAFDVKFQDSPEPTADDGLGGDSTAAPPQQMRAPGSSRRRYDPQSGTLK